MTLLGFKLKPSGAGPKCWYETVESVVRVRDDAGHGPEVGSEEWMRAVSKSVSEGIDSPLPKLGTKERFDAINKYVLDGLFPKDKNLCKKT